MRDFSARVVALIVLGATDESVCELRYGRPFNGVVA